MSDATEPPSETPPRGPSHVPEGEARGPCVLTVVFDNGRVLAQEIRSVAAAVAVAAAELQSKLSWPVRIEEEGGVLWSPGDDDTRESLRAFARAEGLTDAFEKGLRLGGSAVLVGEVNETDARAAHRELLHRSGVAEWLPSDFADFWRAGSQ